MSFAAVPALAQQGWQSESDPDLGSEEVVIVKERQNELPPANRNFQKVPPQQLSQSNEQVSYDFSNYAIQLKPIDPTLRVLTIKSDPPTPYYNRYIKAGGGNYLNSYVDAWINSQRNPSYLYGLHFNHRAAVRGPVDGSNSGYSNNKLAFKGSYFSKNATLDGNAYVARNRYNFYGYNEEELDPERVDIRQLFNLAGMRIGIANAESEKFGIGAGVGYEHTSNPRGINENNGKFDGRLRYELSELLGVQVNTDLIMSRYEFAEERIQNRALFRLAPAFNFNYEPVKIRAGFNIAYENDTAANAGRTHFYPKAEISITPSENFTAMVGVDGNILPVTYRSLSEENPFIGEQTTLLHSNKTIDFYGSLKGRVAGGFGFGAGFSVANYQHMYYFVNSNTDSSRFDVLYDPGNTSLVNIYTELSYHSTNRFQTSLRADYFGYDPGELPVAWHKPEYKLEWLGNYNVYDKILIKADAYLLGGIVAREIGTLDGEVKLDPIIDLGIGAEYRFSPQASAFLEFDNLLAKEYQRFYNYPSRRLVVSLGASYAF